MKVNRKVYRRAVLIGLFTTVMNIMACSSIPLIKNDSLENNNQAVSDETFIKNVLQRTLTQRLQDESIESRVKINIEQLNRDFSNTTRIEVNSFDGRVLLTGEVPNEDVKLTIQAFIASMPEVKAIYNELKISRQHTLSYKIHDSYINSKLAQKIMLSKDISMGQIDITTESGMIYVMGRVTEYQQNRLIELANKTPGVLELVLLTKIFPTESQ